MKRTLIVSEFAPPRLDAQAIAWGNILKYFPVGSFYIYSDVPDKSNWAIDTNSKLDCNTYYFKTPQPEFRLRYSYLFGFKPINRLCILLPFVIIPFILIKGLYIIIRENINNILASNNSGPFFLSAWLMHKMSRKPFYIYLFDCYSKQHLDPVPFFFGRNRKISF